MFGTAKLAVYFLHFGKIRPKIKWEQVFNNWSPLSDLLDLFASFFYFRFRPSSRAENSEMWFSKRSRLGVKNYEVTKIVDQSIAHWKLSSGRSSKMAWNSPKVKISSTFANRAFIIKNKKIIANDHVWDTFWKEWLCTKLSKVYFRVLCYKM